MDSNFIPTVLTSKSLKKLTPKQQIRFLKLCLLLTHKPVISKNQKVKRTEADTKYSFASRRRGKSSASYLSTVGVLKEMNYPLQKKSLKSFGGMSKYVQKMYIQEFKQIPFQDTSKRNLYPVMHKKHIKRWIKEYFEVVSPNFWDN